MTVEAAYPIENYIISGIGPYSIPWPYGATTIRAQVAIDGTMTDLAAADFAPAPLESATSGNLFLTPAAAAANAGRAIAILRETPAEQGWVAQLGGRETGMAKQLDEMVMHMQEQRVALTSSLRVSGATAPMLAPENGAVIMWSDGRFTSGPTASDIANAQENAETAAAAAAVAVLYAPAYFADVAALRADVTVWPAGTVLNTRAEGFAYQVAASGASDHHLTRADGTKLYVRNAGISSVLAFWAAGDGVTDDTVAFQKALAAGWYVRAPRGTYRISGTLTVGTATLDLCGSTLSVAGSAQVFTVAGGAVISGIIDGLNGAHTAYPSEILPSIGSKIIDLTYKNFAGLLANNQTYPIMLPMFGAYDFEIKRVTIKDITQQDDGILAAKGFVGGIYFTSPTLGTQAEVSRGVIEDIYGENIYGVDAGSGLVQDADFIRSYFSGVGDLSPLNWPISFRNIITRNVAKRAFKLVGMNGGTISGVWALKDSNATGSMYAGMSVTGHRWKIDNVHFAGYVERGLEISGDDAVVDGVLYSTLSTGGSEYALLIGSSVGSASRAIVSNIQSDQAAAAVYFYDSFDSLVQGVSVRGNAAATSLAVRTNNTSGGNNNTIIGVESRDAGLLVDGGASLIVKDFAVRSFASLAYPFSVVNGSLHGRGISITSSRGRRMMNIAPMAGQTVDLDDVTLYRASDASNWSTNNYSMFTTVDAAAGANLRIGSIKILAGANPAGTAASNAGRAHVRIANLNYMIDRLTVVNAAARGEVGQDVYIDSSNGKCSIGTLEQRQDVAGGNITIVAPTSGKLTIRHLELDNAFASNIAAYIGTIFARSTATVTGALNTPTTIAV